MKFNWGTGIALVYVLFAGGMIALVMASRNHDPGLVSKDYYVLDLNYQKRIEQKQNTETLAQKPAIQFLKNEQALRVQFSTTDVLPTSGTLKIYRSTTTADDVSFPIKLDEAGGMNIPTNNMAGGRWHVDVEWQAGQTPYFYDLTVNI